jgi:hypothetical protein
LGQEFDVIEPVSTPQLLISDNLEVPTVSSTPRLARREFTLIIIFVDQWLRFALNQDVLTVSDDVEIWGIGSCFSPMLILNRQRLLGKPRYLLFKIKQKYEIALNG